MFGQGYDAITLAKAYGPVSMPVIVPYGPLSASPSSSRQGAARTLQFRAAPVRPNGFAGASAKLPELEAGRSNRHGVLG